MRVVTSTGYKENLASRYRYDLLNRIRVDTLSTRVSDAWTATPNYRSSYTYDGNGNLKSLVRVDSAGTLMDSLVYRYQTNRNRLTHVDDPGGVAGNHSFDVDDQDTNTYTYDASGNMIGDTASGITAIVWTPSNKIQSITKGSTSKLEYTYDAMGNRVVKRFYQPTSTLKSTTWYARDAQGNILSVYERPHADSAIKQSEVHIYGSSRLGIEQRGITYSTSNYAWIGSEQHRNAGSKRYELTDHLGNVRVTISDLLIARPTGFGDTTQDAEVIDRRDYYPFGMEMPGRRWRASGEDAARFGFNGKENDNEVKGEGNQQDYGFRIYDPRIARFLSVDPKEPEYSSLSPYAMAGNSPIVMLDKEGEDFGLCWNEETQTLTIVQNIYTVDQKSYRQALAAASLYNEIRFARNGINVEFSIVVKPPPQLYEMNEIWSGGALGSDSFEEFQTEIAYQSAVMLATDDPLGSSFLGTFNGGIVQGSLFRGGVAKNGDQISMNTHVANSQVRTGFGDLGNSRTLVGHEIGHTLGLDDAGGEYYSPDGIMNYGGVNVSPPIIGDVEQILKYAKTNLDNTAAVPKVITAPGSVSIPGSVLDKLTKDPK